MQSEYTPHEREEEFLLGLKLMLWLWQDGTVGSNPPAEDKFPYND